MMLKSYIILFGAATMLIWQLVNLVLLVQKPAHFTVGKVCYHPDTRTTICEDR